MVAIVERKSDERTASPLKWAGGKRWQVAHIRPLWEPYRERRYVEPFCGGLAMALGLRPERAVLNDANPHLINFYRWVQRGLVVRIPLDNSEATYYRHRERFNALVAEGGAGSQEAAALFYYLNRTGYNGLCRFNRDGRFNVPFGRYAAIRYQRDFAHYQPVFKNWTFSSGDFDTVALDPEDFVYADPPYDVEFTQYAGDRFRWTDQERAARWLAYRPCAVVLVNQATDRIERLYQQLGFTIAFVDGPRRISCSGNRSPAREIIATRRLRSARAIGGPHLHAPESRARVVRDTPEALSESVADCQLASSYHRPRLPRRSSEFTRHSVVARSESFVAIQPSATGALCIRHFRDRSLVVRPMSVIHAPKSSPVPRPDEAPPRCGQPGTVAVRLTTRASDQACCHACDIGAGLRRSVRPRASEEPRVGSWLLRRNRTSRNQGGQKWRRPKER